MNECMVFDVEGKEERYIKVAPHFTVGEFACKDGSRVVLIDRRLVKVLELIRELAQAPVVISSAYRTPAHNKKVHGKPASKHLFGMAADIKVKGMDTVKLYDIACKALDACGYAGGVIWYPHFVHVDVRGEKYRAPATN